MVFQFGICNDIMDLCRRAFSVKHTYAHRRPVVTQTVGCEKESFIKFSVALGAFRRSLLVEHERKHYRHRKFSPMFRDTCCSGEVVYTDRRRAALSADSRAVSLNSCGLCKLINADSCGSDS